MTISVIFVIVFLSLSFVFIKNALHMFQQNHYELYRYAKWLFNKNNIRFSLTLVYLALMIIECLIFKDIAEILIGLLLSIIFAIYLIVTELDTQYIKPLVITSRVKRQIVLTTILSIILTYAYTRIMPIWLDGFIAIYGPYLLVFLIGALTEPVENLIKKHYEDDAKKILYSMKDLITIGITGSYGKTSTKNIVSSVLGETYYTLMTPASYNTPMGITRTIREMMKPIHEVFVCEISATRVGQVSYLMDFVKPKYGIVTSIGPQHLLTFKTMDNIINEKMRMIEMLPQDGLGIINLDNEFIENYKIKNNVKVVSLGINNKNANYVAKDIEYSKDGSSFIVKLGRRNYTFETCLLGEHNITNLLAAIALAYELGLSAKEIVKNVKAVKQVEHRLEVKKINNYTFIDDAFNSNPVGSKMALDVLKMMPGKRVIVTPGMIDLGEKENDYNYDFGKYMKNKADFVILVGEKQTQYIYNGLNDSKYNMKNVLVVKSAKEALAYVYGNFSSKDTILLENDLPDAFSM